METPAEPASSTSRITTRYWMGKLFSLVGILPLGVYVLVHLYNNTSSLSGPVAFNRHLGSSRSTPFYVPLAILVIWVPIVFHGLYGLFVVKYSRPNVGRFRYFENLKYVLQRLSGIGLLLFIPAHIFKTRIEPVLEGKELDFAHMVEGMHEPLTLVVYLLGVLGVAYHLSNGAWQFAIGWGLTTTQKGMKRVQWASILLFLVLLTLGFGAIRGFLQAGV